MNVHKKDKLPKIRCAKCRKLFIPEGPYMRRCGQCHANEDRGRGIAHVEDEPKETFRERIGEA